MEEYLIYRKRIRELLDIAQIARDIQEKRYEPRDMLGRGPKRFSEAVGDTIKGLFASLIDPHSQALNVFDVWLALYPEKKDRINKTWSKVKPQVRLIRNYRNDVVAHANKNLRRYVGTQLEVHGGRREIIEAMQEFFSLAAQLMREEATILPEIRSEVDPIIRKSFPRVTDEQRERIKDFFLSDGETAGSEPEG